MSPETERKLAQVKKYSASLQTLFQLAAAFAGIAGLVSLLLVLTAPIGGEDSGRTTIAIGIPGPFAIVLTGIIIIIVSWVMDVGRELREEHDLTV